MHIYNELLKATLETLYMTFFSGFLSVVFGIPIGILLYLTSINNDTISRIIYRILDGFINIFRSIPFIILIVLVIPLTKLIAGTIIGPKSAVVSLTIAAIPFMARLSENTFNSLPKEMLDTAHTLGMNNTEFILKMLLPETLPKIVSDITLLLINLITYTAIAGAVGAGGLGAMAINYGYQRFRFDVLIYDIIILISITQLIQAIGKNIEKKLLL
ncbi:methionine ABC transporter permease [Marinitoga sp. 1135]|uniref:ABC-type metal ion transport system, permease component n=1 Tax=Marinitoga piezophila (strain DSM 14283 / JCM 11233 / KA3) TaxID=443254 RepID=H2J2U7_MARPK|nr:MULTISPECIES: methionine ABC transporter permease [Marinitoga]AEX84541.1 ABC-type metal ion transport system, permease component [Marinitoga piezophila KA3]APT75032.1 methionine ABC transporter permease [Marinitoga sp. 1137]NUU94786.1 methionine ABC transporter permease [Marinitoga sp. 1135]NUU96715.1 methionine ABC transporter permease [Marinitoga sp. 1138]